MIINVGMFVKNIVDLIFGINNQNYLKKSTTTKKYLITFLYTFNFKTFATFGMCTDVLSIGGIPFRQNHSSCSATSVLAADH